MPCSSHASRFAPHALALLGLALAPLTASAADITLQGTLARDDQVQLFDVTAAAPGTVDIRGFGYGGGTTATGVVVPRGGFDNILTLVDAAGTLITDNDDGAGAAIDPSTGIAGDARITTTLAPGGYVVALTQFDNFALGPTLADGFYEAGYPNFTADPGFGVVQNRVTHEAGLTPPGRMIAPSCFQGWCEYGSMWRGSERGYT